LHAFEEMPKHKVNEAITVQCLQGSVLFSTADQNLELITGSVISLPGKGPHSLTARRGSLMLVTVAEKPASPNCQFW
jgi:quercetin dioxygenase-like cupin family protein